MKIDRTVRFLTALGGASTSRVLNLCRTAAENRDDPDYRAHPLFVSPIVNRAFLIKHRLRSDEAYLFSLPRPNATKLILPFDPADLRAGGRSIFIEQRGFEEALRVAGNYTPEALARDLPVLRLLAAAPSFDPFLLRESLRDHGVTVAPCYFALSEGDQERMHQFVGEQLAPLIRMANGGSSSQNEMARMVAAMLSSRVDEKLEPLGRMLELSGAQFREGIFSWRGFLYYKWSMTHFWPDVMEVLRQIGHILPEGPVTAEQRDLLTLSRRSIITMVRDNAAHVERSLSVYDWSFGELLANQAPGGFRDFLLAAPAMFLELGEKLGAVSHVVSFWRYRFPSGATPRANAEELSAIFQDFLSGFAEKPANAGPGLPRPPLIDATNRPAIG